jgi:lipopolysaccharide export system protein LptC
MTPSRQQDSNRSGRPGAGRFGSSGQGASEQGSPGQASGQNASGQVSVAPAATGRTRAFRSAASHSQLVVWLRRLILGGAAAAVVGLGWAAFFRPLDVDGAHVSVDGIGLSGDKVTMERPKMTGIRRDGRPYEVSARSGIQNPHKPDEMELIDLDARLRLSDDGQTRVLGDHGLYNSVAQTLDLTGHVHIKGVNYDLGMQSAAMNFKSGGLVSNEPVKVLLSDGWVNADSMVMADNGAKITFTGNVQSSFKAADQSGSEDDKAADSAKGN